MWDKQWKSFLTYLVWKALVSNKPHYKGPSQGTGEEESRVHRVHTRTVWEATSSWCSLPRINQATSAKPYPEVIHRMSYTSTEKSVRTSLSPASGRSKGSKAMNISEEKRTSQQLWGGSSWFKQQKPSLLYILQPTFPEPLLQLILLKSEACPCCTASLLPKGLKCFPWELWGVHPGQVGWAWDRCGEGCGSAPLGIFSQKPWIAPCFCLAHLRELTYFQTTWKLILPLKNKLKVD